MGGTYYAWDGAGTHGRDQGSVDVGEDMCQGWDGIVVDEDVWGEVGTCGRRPGHVGGGQDMWEEARMCGRRPGCMGGGWDTHGRNV